MNTKQLALSTFFSLLLPLTSQAAQAEDVYIVKKFDNAVIEDSSAHNRIGQDYVLTYETGFAVAPAPGAGLTFGKYLNRNSLVQANISSGAFPFFFFTMFTSTATVNFKKFVGNSFYYRAGAGVRDIKVQDWDINRSTFKGQEIGRSQSLVGDLAIGNQWQWKYFTLGVDWIGIMPSLATLQSKTDTSGIRNEADRQKAMEDWDQIAKLTTTQLLRFNIGASF